jgi:predicted enzyme related to lactoylglutathione lyase
MHSFHPYLPGQFCWTELQSSTPDSSRAFYQALFEWHQKPMPISDGETLTLFSVQMKPVASLRPVHPIAASRCATTRWLSYLHVADAVKQTELAEQLGATILMPVHTLPDAGKQALIREPGGIILGLWECAHTTTTHPNRPAAGSMCWHDLYTNDLEATHSFLTAMFSLHTTELDVPGMRIVLFSQLETSTRHEFALMRLPLPEHPPGAQPFFAVSDANATLEKAQALGARVICPPTDAGAGRFAHFQDPEGATFGIFEWATPNNDSVTAVEGRATNHH